MAEDRDLEATASFDRRSRASRAADESSSSLASASMGMEPGLQRALQLALQYSDSEDDLPGPSNEPPRRRVPSWAWALQPHSPSSESAFAEADCQNCTRKSVVMARRDPRTEHESVEEYFWCWLCLARWLLSQDADMFVHTEEVDALVFDQSLAPTTSTVAAPDAAAESEPNLEDLCEECGAQPPSALVRCQNCRASRLCFACAAGRCVQLHTGTARLMSTPRLL